MKYVLKRYRAQISFYFIKVIWALKCVKERFNDSLKILGDQQHETLEEYIDAALTLRVNIR